MEDRVSITGHLPMDDFEQYIVNTDIALNMRERTVGETSASLCRILSGGVCSVVSDVGWYAELPADSVVKVSLDAHTDAQLLAFLRRLIEDAWSKETRSPSQIMQELAKSLREAGLQIFRHRRGMLFVSPIRVRPFAHDHTTFSPQIKAILEAAGSSICAG